MCVICATVPRKLRTRLKIVLYEPVSESGFRKAVRLHHSIEIPESDTVRRYAVDEFCRAIVAIWLSITKIAARVDITLLRDWNEDDFVCAIFSVIVS